MRPLDATRFFGIILAIVWATYAVAGERLSGQLGSGFPFGEEVEVALDNYTFVDGVSGGRGGRFVTADALLPVAAGGKGHVGETLWQGFPSANDTGAPAETALTAYTGPMTISTDGTLIENVIINGTLSVAAADVTIKNCIIQNFGSWGVEGEKARNLRIEHCDFIGGGTRSSAILAGLGANIIGNDIHGLVIGIQLADGAATVRDNYIHDLADTGADPHFDGITVLGGQNGVLIEHNTIMLPDSQGTAAVFIKTEFGSVNDVVVRNNLMTGDPSYTMYVEDTAKGNITNVLIENNYIERGYYGYFNVQDSNPIIRNNVLWQAGVDPTIDRSGASRHWSDP